MIFGLLRIKNESRWIERVIRSIQPVCENILIFDDHSTDATPEICTPLEKVTLFKSPFEGLDESRDKQFLLDRAFELIPHHDRHLTWGNPSCPYWALAIDGDEELVAADYNALRVSMQPDLCAISLHIIYLWNDPNHWRVDGVYRSFYRPSLFRMMNKDFKYRKTPFGNGANFHCSSIPQELLHHSQNPRARSAARLLHWGYFDRELREKKFEWYNRIDPNNGYEDCYRHMVVGDLFPAESQFRHGGPLKLEALNV